VVAVDGVTQAARAALAATITSGGVTCRPYPSWDVSSGSIATLGSARWELAEGPTQRWGITAIVFPVRIYQVVDASVDKSLEYHDSAFQNVIDGLGADRTLGGKVAWSDVSADAAQEFYREPNGQAYAVISLEVRVAPFANAA
jgi:hypothetical protein